MEALAKGQDLEQVPEREQEQVAAVPRPLKGVKPMQVLLLLQTVWKSAAGTPGGRV